MTAIWRQCLSRHAFKSHHPSSRINHAFRCFGTQSDAKLDKKLITALRREAPIDIHPEVQDALEKRRPVVALESAVITNGMPYPTNLSAAKLWEQTVRTTGATPATIALIGGRVKIGLTESELEQLADLSRSNGAVKVSRRDIAAVISAKRDGGTTCAATLIFASLAGIKVCSFL
jgi:pseudouridine-5'-phosphate glycosidase/pseudouridine kinase